MQSKRCNFEVDNFKVVEENSNSQFATLEFDVCRSGDNSHEMPISRSAIQSAAMSIKGKPILAAFDVLDTDFLGHEENEQARKSKTMGAICGGRGICLTGLFEFNDGDLVRRGLFGLFSAW